MKKTTMRGRAGRKTSHSRKGVHARRARRSPRAESFLERLSSVVI